MNLTNLSRYIDLYLNAGVAVELVSAPGVGKSEFVEQTVARNSARDGFEWGLSKVFLATQTPTDLMGFLVPSKREDGSLASRFTEPAWMTTEDGRPLSDFKRGILFLDEFGQGDADTKRAAAELLLNGRLGPHKIPEGWSVVSATNRSNDRSGVTKNFDFVINRRAEVHITPDLQSWENWAFKAGIRPEFIGFANANPSIVFSENVPDKQGPWCTPRSLVKLCHLLTTSLPASEPIPTDATTVEIAAGMIGEASTHQLFATIKLANDLPAYRDIIADPTAAKLPPPSKPDAQILVTYNLAARVVDKDLASVITYMDRMPKEFALVFAKAAVRRDPDLVNTKAMGDWAVRNQSLMAVMSELN